MSAQLGPTASFFSVALLAGLLPAQEKAKTVDKLRKENAALRQQVKTLRAELDAKKKATNRKRLAAAKNQKDAVKEFERLVVLTALRNDRQGLLGRLVDAELRAHGRLSKADYRNSVEKLRRATQKLKPISDPAKAREVADEIERALLDVRRELWKLEQAKKKKAKDPTKKKDKQPDSSVVRVNVPVLADRYGEASSPSPGTPFNQNTPSWWVRTADRAPIVVGAGGLGIHIRRLSR